MEQRRPTRIVLGFAIVAAGAFLLAALATHSPAEGPFPDAQAAPVAGNACGPAGAYVSAYGLALIGWSSWLVAAGVAIGGLMLTLGMASGDLGIRSAGLALILTSIMGGAAGFVSPDAGGMLGILLVGHLRGMVGPTGAVILMTLCVAMGLFLAAGAEAAALCSWLWRTACALGAWARPKGRRAGRRPRRAKKTDRKQADLPDDIVEDAPGLIGLGLAPLVEDGVPLEPEPEPEEVAEPEPAPELEVVMHGAPSDDLDDGFEPDWDPDSRVGGEFRLPPPDILSRIEFAEAGDDESEIRERGQLLQRTLSEFKVSAHVVRVSRGPVITMYELSLAPGTKVSKVETLADDLAIALRAPNVRIVSPLPGRNTIGIEVPNAAREMVSVRDLMDDMRRTYEKLEIPLFLGRDTAGHPLILDLAACPHLLVAGATGSGKSVAINSMIASVLMTRRPDEVQLLLIDPKSVEFTDFAHLPHLICPVVSDMKKAASVMKWACKKMDERYSLLNAVGVRNLKGYNNLGEEGIRERLDPEADLDDVPFYMPHVIIIVDEFGELMMVAAKEVEAAVIRLSQKARAVGIHLICATQRPSVDVITGLIKSNLSARIAFHVSSKVDSRTILDRNGAELLLGRGDMLLLPPGTSRLVRAQGAYIPDEDLRRLVEYLETQGLPQFRADLREYHARSAADGQSDELYEDAVRIVLESQRGSVSLLQRRLAIGYSRAARLVDMMAEAGIVGAYKGSQARQVLMSLEEWQSAHAKV
jgi:S-DNA-T family DNA segregation ATPase FtsK/SpoIIIE